MIYSFHDVIPFFCVVCQHKECPIAELINHIAPDLLIFLQLYINVMYKKIMIVKKVNNENAYSLNVLTQTVVNCKFDSYGSNSFNYYVSYLHIKCWIIITNRIFIHCLYDIYKNISLISGLIIPWLICYDAQLKNPWWIKMIVKLSLTSSYLNVPMLQRE